MANSSHEFTKHSQVMNMPTLLEQKLGVFKEKNQQLILDHKHLITRSPNNIRNHQHIIKTSHQENLINKSQVNVPFSWEIKPGVSKLKVTAADDQDQERIERWHLITLMNLPSPPCPSKASSRADHDQELAQQVPLYLCPFQSPLISKSSSRRSSRVGKQQLEDPFLVAYRKCTELYAVNGKLLSSDIDDFNRKIDSRSKKMKMKNMNMYVLSCKYSCAVITDNLMLMSPRCPERRRKGEKFG
ncbi:hypothetical protein Dsin_003071 [Dipteronia sinensis]|uniref:Uncharacterized protein n=1 Tax=Dipteronia sinensis TaxID=43782 RepID=A0AAE0ELU6_9ROSI|nr:hypothetical protein Dsin_003071 [Dipteronia sinensis]